MEWTNRCGEGRKEFINGGRAMVPFGLATLWAAATINSCFCSLNLVSVAKGRDLVLVCVGVCVL